MSVRDNSAWRRLRVGIAVVALCTLAQAQLAAGASEPARARASTAEQAQSQAMIEQLRRGGLVLYFRHADTRGMPCDRSFRLDDREGQRNLSAAGREQARAIGRRLAALRIPLHRPVLAGPVYRARDTAELAFGAHEVEVSASLLADDYSGDRLGWVLAEHRRLMFSKVALGANRVLVGHRTPAIMVLGEAVGGDAFPEGAALVLQPAGESARLLGILALAPIPGGGFHECGGGALP